MKLKNDFGTLTYRPAKPEDLHECDSFFGLTPENIKGVVIDLLNIKKSERGKGHGEKLLSDFLALAPTKGFNYVMLQAWPQMGLERGTEEDNPAWQKNQKRLIRWYKRHGFREFDFGYMARRI
jgi:GNAT superfamily N-acetyltransferase